MIKATILQELALDLTDPSGLEVIPFHSSSFFKLHNCSFTGFYKQIWEVQQHWVVNPYVATAISCLTVCLLGVITGPYGVSQGRVNSSPYTKELSFHSCYRCVQQTRYFGM